MQTSLWFLGLISFFNSLFYCCIDFNFVFSSMHTDIKSHYTLLRQNSLDLGFYLYWQWVNFTVAWIPGSPGWNWAQQEGSRPRWCLLFISRWELFLFSQFSQHISLLGLQLQGAHLKGEWMIQTETPLLVCFIFYDGAFSFICEEMKILLASNTTVHMVLTKVYTMFVCDS